MKKIESITETAFQTNAARRMMMDNLHSIKYLQHHDAVMDILIFPLDRNRDSFLESNMAFRITPVGRMLCKL